MKILINIVKRNTRLAVLIRMKRIVKNDNMTKLARQN